MTQHAARNELPIYRVRVYRAAVTLFIAYGEGFVTDKNHQDMRPVIVFADNVFRVLLTIT